VSCSSLLPAICSTMITIIGDSVSFYEEEPDTTEALGKTAFFSSKKKDIGYDVTLVARISAVLVDGDDVQANDIVISGNKAYIAYNYAGEPFKGAVQIVDISDKDEPEILEEIKMPSMDVNALYIDGSNLIFGGAADPDIWGYKSFIGKISTRKISPTDIAASITELPSHAVTGITKKNSYYYATVGAADGVLLKLNKSFGVAESIDLSDGRDIEEYDGGLVVISGTTDNPAANGKISIVSKNLDIEEELSVTDFGSDYHKATIEIYDKDMALLALSKAGMKVLDLDNGSRVVYELPNPQTADVAFPYTNSVSSDKELIFTANGEYGFRVLYNEDEDFENVSVAGYFPFNDPELDDLNYSANHIEYKSDHLFVACGVGGVQIFYLDEDD